MSPETHPQPDDHGDLDHGDLNHDGPNQGAPDPTDPELPLSLQADLRARFGVTPDVPPEREAELLERIHALVHRRRPAVRLMRWGSGAAAVVAGAFLLWVMQPRTVDTPDPQVARYDVDGSGHVDILDAFGLARWLDNIDRDPRPSALPHDLNDDGLVDQRDVDLIAARAVALR